jgi:TRAP transporter TAXI family solute receptor
MRIFNRIYWHPILAEALIATLCLTGAIWLALNYFVPTPPSEITIATAFRGGAYEYFGNRYKEILARSHVVVEVRLTDGAGENLRLLHDKNSNVQVGIVAGATSTAKASPGVMSLGRINYQPYWVFYRSAETWPDLASIRGKRIAVGPIGSGTRLVADTLLGASGINYETEVVAPIFGQPAVKALIEQQVDAIFHPGTLDSPLTQTLVRNPDIRLMNFPRAEALTRIYPYLVKLVLPEGVIDFQKNIPSTDVNIIGTTNAIVVRKDLHPQIIYLLVQALKEVHGGAGVFHRAGDFPTQFDPEYPLAESALDFYRSGPSFLNRYLPFWIANYVQRGIAVAIAAIAIILPLFNYLPKLYRWFVSERILKLYSRLRVVEHALHTELEAAQIISLQAELESIDRGAIVLRVPTRFSDLFFSLKIHIDLIRTRLASRLVEARRQIPRVAA